MISPIYNQWISYAMKDNHLTLNKKDLTHSKRRKYLRTENDTVSRTNAVVRIQRFRSIIIAVIIQTIINKIVRIWLLIKQANNASEVCAQKKKKKDRNTDDAAEQLAWQYYGSNSIMSTISRLKWWLYRPSHDWQARNATIVIPSHWWCALLQLQSFLHKLMNQRLNTMAQIKEEKRQSLIFHGTKAHGKHKP